MEIRIRDKSYKIAWEFIIAPLLLLLVAALVFLSNLPAIRQTWIDISDNASAAVSTSPKEVQNTEGLQRPTQWVTNTEAQVEAPESPSQSALQTAKVNINKAGVEELMSLPNIGEVKARAIIEYRKSHGPFKSVDELDNVKGIGSKTLEKLRPLVSVE